MPANTRERLIDAAGTRFYRDGFRNVGLDQILDDVGITKTAFYKHFESKDDLMVEVLNQQSAWLQNHFLNVIREHGGESAVGQLRALFDGLQQIIEADGFHGCIFVNASMEFPIPHEPAHQAAMRNRSAVEQLIHGIAERAGASDPQALARELVLVMEGAYVAKQVTGQKDIIEIARKVGDKVIDAHLANRSSVRAAV